MRKGKVGYAGWMAVADTGWPAIYPTYVRPPYIIGGSAEELDSVLTQCLNFNLLSHVRSFQTRLGIAQGVRLNK